MSYLLTELVHIGIPVVRTDGRAHGHVITKISRMGRLPNFLTHGAPLSQNQAPVTQTLDSAIQRINHYPTDSAIGFPNTYPLDSDLSDG